MLLLETADAIQFLRPESHLCAFCASISFIILTVRGVFSVMLCTSLAHGYAVLRRESREVKGLLQQQAIWAASIMKLQFLATTILAVTSLLPMLEIFLFNMMVVLNPEYKRIPGRYVYIVGLTTLITCRLAYDLISQL